MDSYAQGREKKTAEPKVEWPPMCTFHLTHQGGKVEKGREREGQREDGEGKGKEGGKEREMEGGKPVCILW